MRPQKDSADSGAGSGCMARLVRCFFILPAVFLREFGCVYWEIATKPEWNRGDRLMARYFWPLCVIFVVILSWTAPQRVKLEEETRPQQEQPQPQAVPPEKGTASLGAAEDNLVGIDVTTEVGGITPDKDRPGEIQDEADKIEGPDVHVLNSSTNVSAHTQKERVRRSDNTENK